MRAVLLFLVVLLALNAIPAASQGGSSICGRYTTALFGNDSVANESALITAIVTRAVLGGSGAGFNGQVVLGLFNSSGPLYNIFTGQTQYRSGAPNYTDTTSASFASLAGHLVSYFGALFGCQIGAPGGIAVVHSSDMWNIHKNMGITQTMESYFINTLATTLVSFGVASADVTTAGAVLSFFNRGGVPVQASAIGNNYISNSTVTGLTQICGDSTCALATPNNVALYFSSSSGGSPTAGPSATGSSTGSGAYSIQASAALVVALVALVSAVAL